MYLDGCFMLSEKNQDYYHEECIKLIPNNAKKILIIGGGDCAIAKLISKHFSVKQIDIAEIDKKVVDISKNIFQNILVTKKDENEGKHNQEDDMLYLKASEDKK